MIICNNHNAKTTKTTNAQNDTFDDASFASSACGCDTLLIPALCFQDYMSEDGQI